MALEHYNSPPLVMALLINLVSISSLQQIATGRCGFMLLHYRFAMAGLLLVLATGCAQTAMPQLCNPPSASTQLATAREFDPFPDPTIAPPILGGRPLGFREPRPEPDVTKNFKSALQRGFVLPFAGTAPPPVAPPYPPAYPPAYPPGVVPYAPAAPAPVPGTVAYPPATPAPFDPYAAPGAMPPAYGTAIPQ